MLKNLVHMLLVVLLVLIAMSVASVSGAAEAKILYVGNEKGICQQISPFVDTCRERDLAGLSGMAAIMKYRSYIADKDKFTVVVEEAALKRGSYNPAGLIGTFAAFAVGGSVGQGMMIGNKNPFGREVAAGSDAGFQMIIDGEPSEVRCGDVLYPECRVQVLEGIKKRWPKVGA